MEAFEKEEDFARATYGAPVSAIVKEHAQLLGKYREYVLKELVKAVSRELQEQVPAAYVELAEKMVSKEQEAVMSTEMEKAKELTSKVLKNQLDALRNRHYAKQNFEKKLVEAVERNEETQKRHNGILEEYLKTKLEYKFALKQSENIKKIAPALLEHYNSMHDMSKKAHEDQEKLLERLAPLKSEPANETIRTKRTSSMSSENSSITGESEAPTREITEITDKLFTASLADLDLLSKAADV